MSPDTDQQHYFDFDDWLFAKLWRCSELSSICYLCIVHDSLSWFRCDALMQVQGHQKGGTSPTPLHLQLECWWALLRCFSWRDNGKYECRERHLMHAKEKEDESYWQIIPWSTLNVVPLTVTTVVSLYMFNDYYLPNFADILHDGSTKMRLILCFLNLLRRQLYL